MKSYSVLAAALGATALMAFAAPAEALVIVVNNTGGLDPGSAAGKAFGAAVSFWEHTLTNNVTVNINAGFGDPGLANASAGTSSAYVYAYTSDVEAALKATGTTVLDQVATSHLPALDAAGGIGMITSGYLNPATQTGINTATQVYDNDDSYNNTVLGMTQANAKALFGPDGLPSPVDATITFSSAVAAANQFDYDPTNFISPGQLDFTAVAIHEIAHALGFQSGVDSVDDFGAPNGSDAAANADYNFNNYAYGDVLDLYRYSDNPGGLNGGGPMLDWSAGTDAFFSIHDGHAWEGNQMSTGLFNGDGDQASHWADTGCDTTWGVMAPQFCTGEGWIVSSLDLAAMDAIGWNTNIDLWDGPDFYDLTSDIYRASVPEPEAWTLMVVGLGAMGMVLRRRPKPRRVGSGDDAHREGFVALNEV